MRVLLVDDSKTARYVFTGLLRKMGHEVVTFEDAESALRSCGSEEYELSLLDWMLPGMSGIDLCRNIRILPWGERCVILVITARHKTGDLNEVLNAGADDYIIKPVDEALFMTRIRIAERVFRRKCEILEATEELRAAKWRLEERVRERTEELNRANELLTDSLQEKIVLLSEIHHRVYNNMAIISAFLNLESMTQADNGTSRILRECRQRIKSMALVHEKLYQSRDFKHIDLREYLAKLVNDLMRAYWSGEKPVRLSLNIEDIPLDMDKLVAFGLIVNEVVSSTLRHAFLAIEDPSIEISLAREREDWARLVISDNGTGTPEDLNSPVDNALGLRIIDALVGQVHGEMNVERSAGTVYSIAFPAGGWRA